MMQCNNELAIIAANPPDSSKEYEELLEELLERAINIMHNVIKEMEDIEPPDEFRLLHKKLIQSYLHIAKAYEYMLKGDSDSAEIYIRKSEMFQLEARVEEKKIYKKHNAPKEFINAMDTGIKALKSRLK